TGSMPHTPPFVVTSFDPGSLAVGSKAITVHFNDSVLLSSLAPGDLRVDGVSATGYNVVAGDAITFTLAAPLRPAATVSLAAGSIADVQGTPLQAFNLAPVGIALDQRVQGSIDTVGLERAYTFTATAGQHVMLDINNAGNNTIAPDIWGPAGNLV